MEITVKNYRVSQKFGWGWSTTPTGNGTEIEIPSMPDYTGTLKQIVELRDNDAAFQNLGGASYTTAWFYNGNRITHTWNFLPIGGVHGPTATYWEDWEKGFHLPVLDSLDIKIRTEEHKCT